MGEFLWQKSPLITMQDIVRRLKQHKTVFGDRVVLAINEQRAVEMGMTQFPYLAVVHGGDDQDFNWNPNERVYRMTRDVDLCGIFENPPDARLDAAGDVNSQGLQGSRELYCAMNGWHPNSRYRPVQQMFSRWVTYLSTARAVRVDRFRLSFLLGPGDGCALPEVEGVEGYEIILQEVEVGREHTLLGGARDDC